jgi:vacuolar-type H+-ATPase subunit E/Vma4
MTHSKLLVSISLAVPMMLVAACQQSSAEAQNKAVAAQREADDKIAKVQREADQKAAEAQKKADDTTAQARNEANKDTSQAQANANDVIRSANESILKARSDIREWAQKKLNSLDSDVDVSKTKAQTASVKEKASFDRALGDVEAKRTAVQNQLASLDAQPASGLDQFKKGLEKQIDAFSNSVSRLKATL